ncbi:hypothetical protein [Silanimonas sp.]|uniref:hypothetical protein n=1 Tax=Silanimonas sp. TaxID=1929290 RepID=UPI0022BEB558|nr:hypothetical protein [Silanimonas sp.]MCZ8063988.1 hypothetical protein [Silanimonas sp.]
METTPSTYYAIESDPEKKSTTYTVVSPLFRLTLYSSPALDGSVSFGLVAPFESRFATPDQDPRWARYVPASVDDRSEARRDGVELTDDGILTVFEPTQHSALRIQRGFRVALPLRDVGIVREALDEAFNHAERFSPAP